MRAASHWRRNFSTSTSSAKSIASAFGNAHEVGDGSVPAGLVDKAYLAQSNCPEIAIEVTEE